MANALAPVQAQYPQSIIYHNMDDILVCAQDDSYLQDTIQYLILNLTQHGLQIAPEKIQRIAPWKYLGWILTE